MQSSTYGIGTSLVGRPERRSVSTPVHTAVIAAIFVCALPLVAHAATRYVAHTGSDGPNCGLSYVIFLFR